MNALNVEQRPGFTAMSNSQDWALAIVGFAGITMIMALVWEYAYAMEPCPLCLMQRIWVFVAGAIAYASLLHNPRLRIYPLLTGLAAVVGAGFSIRQMWLQNLPADEVPACGPGMSYMIESFPLSDVILAMTSGTGDCAELHPVLGLPISVWALAGFIALFVMAVMQWRAKALR